MRGRTDWLGVVASWVRWVLGAAEADEPQVGQWVRLSARSPLQVESQPIDVLPQGTPLKVLQVESARVWVEEGGKKGWVSAQAVQPLTHQKEGIVEFRLGEVLRALAEPVTSKQGGHWAYVGDPGGGYLCIVLDGQPGPKYDGIVGPGLVFSPDGRRFAYGAWEGDKPFIVLDGQPGPKYDGIVAGTVVARADGAVSYYTQREGHFWHVLHLP